MNREKFIKEQILKRGFNIKSFASYIDMPYSTLLTMLNGSIGGASIDNVIKICKGLQISVSALQEYDIKDNSSFLLSSHEKSVITAYRNNPDMQCAVDKLLGISCGEKIIHT